MSDPNNYTVGWICAISTEYTAARSFLDEKHDRPTFVSPHDGNDYTLGRMGGHNVVIAVLPDGEYGTNSAAAVAKDMLHSFPNVRIGLMVGIGGGAPSSKNDIRLGDIVVSSPANGKGGVYQYDMGKAIQGQGFQHTGFLNKPPRVLSAAVNGLKSDYAEGHGIVKTIQQILAQKKRLKRTHGRPDPGSDRLYTSTKIHEDQAKPCESICGDCEYDLITRSHRDAEEVDDPAIFYGLIASANQVMKDATLRDRLADGENVLCFEMEAAGLMNHFPCLVVRGICDYSDSHKNKAWQGYAAMTAAAYTKDLLIRILPNKIEAEKKISEVLSNIEHCMQVLGSKLDKKEDQAILDWVAPDDYGSKQSCTLRLRQPGTSQWLLDREEFKTWLGGDGGSLFCRGIPGAGKTILTAVVVDHLLAQRVADNDGSAIGVAFLYCSFSHREKQGPEDLLLSVLKHFSQGLQSLPDSVKTLHQTHREARTRPLLPEIVSCLESILKQYKRSFIVVDALDQCPTSCRPKLLTTLFHLRDIRGTNIFATSRPCHEIDSGFFPKVSVLEIEADATDVKQYLDAHMSELPHFVSKQPDLQDLIKQAIVRAVCGMFLLAQLYLSSLRGMQSPRQIKDALVDKKRTYEKLYGDTMKRIESSDQARFAKKALKWVVCARRPLTTSELLHALAVNPGDTALDEDNIPEMHGVISACDGLLTIDVGSDVVRLIHYTAYEYLTNGSSNGILPDAEADIARICTTYMSFDDFERGFCATDADLEARLSKHPLYRYVARNWGYHAREASLPPSDSRLQSFLSSAAKTESAGQAMMAIKEQSPWPGYSQEAPRRVTGLHLAARFGAADIVSDLLTRREAGDCDAQDSHRQTPLMWAAILGNLEIAQMLLRAGADPNLKDKDGRTPLSLAAENGFTDVVKELLKEERLTMGGDSQRDEVGRLPLSWAARNGHVDVVRVLLERSSLEGGEADNPLLWAILQENEAVVKTILEAALREAGPGWGEGIAPKALCLAAELGQVSIFSHLTSALGGDVNCRGDNGKTPLMEAAFRGHDDMVAELLRLGADHRIRDQIGRTAFSRAAELGQDAVVSLLLLHAPAKADVDCADTNDRTPLSLAAGNGHEAVVHALLGLEGDVVSVDAQDTAQQTPLFWAARNDHIDIVKLLLDTGKVKVDAATLCGRTALSEAIVASNMAMVKMLQEHGAVDVGSKPAYLESSKSCFTVDPLTVEGEYGDGLGKVPAANNWDYNSDEDSD
ncbi:hypothetical protein RB598_004658 [Gaeumannomyces tritici]